MEKAKEISNFDEFKVFGCISWELLQNSLHSNMTFSNFFFFYLPVY